MVFSSHLFIFAFLPLLLAVYYVGPRPWRQAVLTLASYLFYGWSNPAFVPLLLFSTTVDYYAGLVQANDAWWPVGRPLAALASGGRRSRTQRAALTMSIVTNLSLLGFFKYFHFAVDSWNGLARLVGVDAATMETTLRVALPLGISFYTFQSMSYSIDVFRGRAAAMGSIVDFACYVAMFPQLVAGPIIRFSEVAEQIRERSHTALKFARGVAFFGLGLSKKVLLANPCGKIADTVFDAAATTTIDAWYGLTAYSFQIYFDFSGYSDMAIGLGLMLGFVFPKNFDAPYRSSSITEFWQRWHISLSTWLRDYLYIPLGGNRRGRYRTYANLYLVMLCGGLWHGASWNFVLWGALHGILLASERAVGAEYLWAWVPRRLRSAWTFFLVLLTWVPFRAPDLAASGRYFQRLFGLEPSGDVAAIVAGLTTSPYLVATFIVAAAIVWTCPPTWTWTRKMSAGKTALVLGLLCLSIIALATQEFNPFLYFIF